MGGQCPTCGVTFIDCTNVWLKGNNMKSRKSKEPAMMKPGMMKDIPRLKSKAPSLKQQTARKMANVPGQPEKVGKVGRIGKPVKGI